MAGLATACGSSGSSAVTPSGSSATTNNAAATASNKTLQEDLTKVGCYSGSIDGALGPLTIQAIRAFQAAAGLSIDGLYGPSTQAKLVAEVQAGTKVCSSSTTTTEPPASSTTTGGSTTTTGSSTTTGGSGAPCTAAAINAGLAGGATVNMWQCSKGWAAGSQNGGVTPAFLVQQKNGAWVPAPADACTNATTLGIPPAILAVSYCKVS